jgi:hypothetical protein
MIRDDNKVFNYCNDFYYIHYSYELRIFRVYARGKTLLEKIVEIKISYEKWDCNSTLEDYLEYTKNEIIYNYLNSLLIDKRKKVITEIINL